MLNFANLNKVKNGIINPAKGIRLGSPKKRLLNHLNKKLSENIGKGKTLKSEFDSLQKEISIDKNKINETSDEFDKILFINDFVSFFQNRGFHTNYNDK